MLNPKRFEKVHKRHSYQRCNSTEKVHEKHSYQSHCVRTFDAVLRNNLYRFFMRCASSPNYFITSL